MVGLDVTHRALFTPAHEQRLEGRVGALVRALLEFYGAFHQREYGWDGSPIHDAVAVAHVARPDLLETIHRGVKVDTGSELSRGRTHVDLRRRAGWEPNAHVAVGIRAEVFLDLLVERLNSLG
jgi:inosine-uridine nucleoside N-ribohydrolase